MKKTIVIVSTLFFLHQPAALLPAQESHPKYKITTILPQEHSGYIIIGLYECQLESMSKCKNLFVHLATTQTISQNITLIYCAKIRDPFIEQLITDILPEAYYTYILKHAKNKNYLKTVLAQILNEVENFKPTPSTIIILTSMSFYQAFTEHIKKKVFCYTPKSNLFDPFNSHWIETLSIIQDPMIDLNSSPAIAPTISQQPLIPIEKKEKPDTDAIARDIKKIFFDT
jgi:hypothetical protein